MPELVGALFVDGANWAHALEGGRLRVNFDRLIHEIQRRTGIKLVSFNFYTAYHTQEDIDRRWAFFNYLKSLGWQVQVMPATLGADGRWRDKEVDVALEAYEEARSARANAILIGSGDQDFAALFRRLPEGIEGWVISFREQLSPVLTQVARVLHIEDLGVLYEVRPSMGAIWEAQTLGADIPNPRRGTHETVPYRISAALDLPKRGRPS
jgi:uncharacterized LabA/DUF88 family protein